MQARLIVYAAMLAGALLFGVTINLCVRDMPSATSPATAADLERFRATLPKRSASPARIPVVTNAEAGPRSACRGTMAVG